MSGRSARESPGAAGGRRELRAALFVDFDNMCISFEELDPLAAHRFATQPARWLAWFESGQHAQGDDPEAGEEPVRRRILVRKCYLNPVTFGRYRADYTRAAFTVVDCPPLTQRGKTSADVYMVMDILDALKHDTEFDEFIILSSDADFTPVLLRLRAYDRQTTILATNFAAATYKAACDLIVPYERFFEEALGIEPEPAGLPHLEQAPTITGGGNGGGSGIGSVGDHEALLPRVARALKERVAAAGPLGPREVPAIFATFPEFRNSDWFGRFSLKGLMTRLLELEPGLAMLGDPNAAWSVRLRDAAPPTPPDRREPDAARPGEQQRASVGEVVRPTPADAPRPVPTLAAIPAERVDAAATPDPTRHDRDLLETAAADRLRDFPEEPEVFFGRVADATGVPALGPAEYARLFEAVAVVAAIPDLDFNERARQIRDALQAEGLTVSRAQVNFVLNVFRQNRIEIARLDAGSLAAAWRDITLTALRNALVPLSPEELRLIDRWLLGGGEPVVTPADEPPAEDEAPAPLAPPVEAGTEAA